MTSKKEQFYIQLNLLSLLGTISHIYLVAQNQRTIQPPFITGTISHIYFSRPKSKFASYLDQQLHFRHYRYLTAMLKHHRPYQYAAE